MEMVSAIRFKQLAKNKQGIAAIGGLRKQMLAPVEPVSDEARSLRFTISTGCIDREQDTIALAGWDLANYLKNPVVLWGHDGSRLPIGRAVNVGVENGALKATVDFIPPDTPEGGQFAEAVYRLARGGFINATSVGFRPIKWTFTQDPERGADDWFPGIDFEAQELVEFSLVTVPANPEALIEPQPLPAPAMPGEVAQPNPTGEEITALAAAAIKQEQATARARRVRLLQLTRTTLAVSNGHRVTYQGN
jgi:HK97 family phage prohead protease